MKIGRLLMELFEKNKKGEVFGSHCTHICIMYIVLPRWRINMNFLLSVNVLMPGRAWSFFQVANSDSDTLPSVAQPQCSPRTMHYRSRWYSRCCSCTALVLPIQVTWLNQRDAQRSFNDVRSRRWRDVSVTDRSSLAVGRDASHWLWFAGRHVDAASVFCVTAATSHQLLTCAYREQRP